MKSVIAVVAVLHAFVPLSAAETMTLPYGIVIEVPAGWRVGQVWENERARETHDFASEEMEKRSRAGSRLPAESLIILAKHPADHVGVNPSIQISRMPLKKDVEITPAKIAEAILPLLTHTFHEVRTEEWLPAITVAGHKAAKATVTYTARSKRGMTVASRGTFVVMIVDRHFYVIGTSSPAEGEDDSRPQFKQFLAKLRFGQPAR